MRRTTVLTTATVTAATLTVTGLTACRPTRSTPPARSADAGVVVERWVEAHTGYVSVRLDDGRRVVRALDRQGNCPLGSKYPVCDA